MTSAEGALPTSVSQLIKLLAEERKNFTSVEIAETLWLAMQIETTAQVVVDEPLRLPSVPVEPAIVQPPNELPPLPAVPAAPPKVNIAAPTPEVGILPPQTLPIWLTDPAMLTDSLAIIRALTPLLRKMTTGIGKRLDESATVENIARTQLCLPILKPEQESWFDIVLVVDRGASMHIWQRLVKDVVKILRSYGAFRDVQLFDLKVNQSAPAGEVVQLISSPHRPGHRPTELIDQRGRRIVIVLSDCAGTYWWDGTLLPMLQSWGKVMPIVVWQMLPAWMWKRTALGRGTSIAIHNDSPGAANQQFQIRVQERKVPEDAQQRIPVPVVTSEVRDLSRWSLMVAGDRRAIMPGFLLPQLGGTVPRSKGIEAIARDRVDNSIDKGNSTEQVAFNKALDQVARERVQRFIELASPPAQRLIMLLAAAPVITLPVVRLIRDGMMYDEPSPLPVAEVFLSGLLQRLSGQEGEEFEQLIQQEVDRQVADDSELQGSALFEATATLLLEPQDFLQYDFVPKVRQILLEVLPTVDTIDVVNSVSAAVERRWNQVSGQDFRAFLTNPKVEVSEDLSGLRSFANVTAEILEQLGGDYASFAAQLRYGAGGDPSLELEVETDDFPLVDLEYEVAQFINFPPLQAYEYKSASIAAILDRVTFETATIERNTYGDWEIQRRSMATWGYTEFLLIDDQSGEGIGLDMIAIPRGKFTMGAPQSEVVRMARERPLHEVMLQSFFLGRSPITQAQWRVVARYSQIERELNPDPSEFKGNNRPVENVSWEDAQEFCQRLSVQTGKDYRLPSEAQWEYGCRAGTKTPFHYGETITTELANYNGAEIYNNGPKGEYREHTTDVETFPANEWGLYDMHGNVWEWCEDDWHSNYEDAPSDGSAWIEIGRKSTENLLRGGSWGLTPVLCRSSCRNEIAHTVRFHTFGLRICYIPP